MKSSTLFGLGVGWQARHWLRFDLTGDYRGDAAFFGADTYQDVFAPTGAATNEYTADIKSWLGLVNAYVDMGNWCGFTPYIGAGIGFSSITVEVREDVNVPNSRRCLRQRQDEHQLCLGSPCRRQATTSRRRRFIDLSYRYADLGNAESGAVTDLSFGTFAYSGQQIRDITTNDLMLGVRYKLQREVVVYQPVK